ncbi:HigA family addiction module antitoxin [Clostridium sp. DL1XJH146]
MAKKIEYQAAIAVPPGETLKELIENIDMSQVELSKRTGLTTKHINEIINEKSPITQETSLKLEHVLGIPASFWNNLESNYQETKARLKAEEEINNELAIAKEIPYAEMAKLKFIESTKKSEEKVINLRNFFGVAKLTLIPDIIEVAFRKKDKETSSSYAIAAWLRKGEIEASKIETAPYNKQKLQKLIPTFRKLTLEKPEVFVPKIINLCASCGVAVVIEPHLSKTYVNGATKWLSKDKVLLQLSLRYSFADIFWFSFFHELGHILKHSKKETFIERTKNIDKDVLEQEADAFASDTLIPKTRYSKFTRENNFISENLVLQFAKNIEISPCIVIGRLQHDKFLNYNQLTNLRPRFCFKN